MFMSWAAPLVYGLIVTRDTMPCVMDNESPPMGYPVTVICCCSSGTPKNLTA